MKAYSNIQMDCAIIMLTFPLLLKTSYKSANWIQMRQIEHNFISKSYCVFEGRRIYVCSEMYLVKIPIQYDNNSFTT